MHGIARKAFLIAGVAAMASVAARAQSLDPSGPDPLGDFLDKALKTTLRRSTLPAPALNVSRP